MTWSESHPKAAIRAEEAAIANRSDFESQTSINDCIEACEDCWTELEDIAEDRYNEPYSGVPAASDAKRLVNCFLDKNSDENGKLHTLFDDSESPYIPSDKAESAKALIGAMVLQNGVDGQNKPDQGYLKSVAGIQN